MARMGDEKGMVKRKFSFLSKNFLGSKDPTPPAIIIFDTKKALDLFVKIFQQSFSFEILLSVCKKQVAINIYKKKIYSKK